jgi:hypothetical protein
MSRFIQSLEARRLFSVTKATLLADAALLAADAAAAKADLKAVFATASADAKAIATDLKGLPKTNQPLFKTLKAEESLLQGTFKKDLQALTAPANALAKRSAAAGIAFMARWTVAVQAKITADLAALASVAVAPAQKLEADFQGSALAADLQAIVDANPSSTTLAADVTRFDDDMQSKGGVLTDALTAFAGQLTTLTTDLAAAPAGPGGGGGNSLPQIVGTYSGSYTVTAGNHVGRVTDLNIQVTSEGADGSLTGTITLTVNGVDASVSFTGTITASGQFTTTFINKDNNSTTLTGTATASAITGTYNTPGDSSGTFSVSK